MGRLVIISNRAPVSIHKENGSYHYEESSGGLASGLRAYINGLKSADKNSEIVWIGWPGASVDDEKKVGDEVLKKYKVNCVFLSEEVMERFYEGFCNKTIWPLFHYFPGITEYNPECWEEYIRVNRIFCEAALKIIKPGDTIWIHDYHLMLLPAMIREKQPNATIGFFLHIPFPSFELFRLLPSQWRKEIMQGLYGADLIGFHTYDYCTYFLLSTLHILGVSHHMNDVLYNDRLVKIGTFPMGIDYSKYHRAATSKEISKECLTLKNKFRGVKLILSIDRQDYTKGIVNRLKGYEHFLENNKGWRQKVTMIMVVVPSRIGVESYQNIKNQTDELVGNINGKFGSVDWTPILYQYRSLSFNGLIALYASSDVALVTPLRDGMNLIAKEYIASRTNGMGGLILSEMAGAADELDESAIINPNNTVEISVSILQMLEMSKAEQIRRIKIMQHRVKTYDVFKWADDFLSTLDEIKLRQERLNAKILGGKAKKEIVAHFKRAKSRILFIDYDGTLVSHITDPSKAKPGKEVLDTIKNLTELEDTRVVLISGRDRHTLEKWFGHLPIELAAEHGVILRIKGKRTVPRHWKWSLIKPMHKNWKKRVMPILNGFSEKLPGSFVEEKEYSIAFHYRQADELLASSRIKEMIWYLENFTVNMDISVYEGNKILEVRTAGIDKGVAIMHWLSFFANKPDFILAAGDDQTDEDMFRVLPKGAYSFKVGMQSSYAIYNLKNPSDTITLLKEFTS
ncbi:MAG TPA: bifunctional alpha,alpha-trehalose-phosphate synthase (UDP-forming)/trehalose-phosphatase [Bacteroidia bacterium]|nr:bifunctional alpha,alpha-trehalose-phosphate synthase (UDP-forming)/trehalose-phosphatase [Bacteroidia bacterium]